MGMSLFFLNQTLSMKELETTQPLFARSINDEIVLHFVSHPSPLTPILKNGIRWNDQKELEIPHLDQQVTDPEARQIIKMLLSRDPLKRGTASGILVSEVACIMRYNVLYTKHSSCYI